MYLSYMIPFISQLCDAKGSCSDLKERAINEYNQALLMPRKKKKRAKKSALLSYSIACHGETIFNKYGL